MLNRFRGNNKFKGKIPDIECERPSSPGPIRLKNTESVEKGGGTGMGSTSKNVRSSTSPKGGQSTSSKSLARRRRRRSLTLCESFSDGESNEGSGFLLRTGSFSEKTSKKWSLPVPSTNSRGSRGSESTETSRSSAELESLSGGEVSPSDFKLSTSTDGKSVSSSTLAPEGASGSREPSESRRKKWSKASQTHSFVKVVSYVFERCKSCDAYIYLSGFKCSKCNIYTHSKCLRSSLIKCNRKPLIKGRRKLPIFGTLLELTTPGVVPAVIKLCAREIEKRGYAIKGIYRVNGNSGRVRKLVRSLELDPLLVDISESNPNDLANVIKEYLRSLPDPLFMASLYRNFINCSKLYHSMKEEERNEKKDEITFSLQSVINMLHPQHKLTLSYLIHHLRFISDNQVVNMMSAKNLGLVFAPSLFRIKYPEGEHILEDLFDNSFQALIIELLINYSTDVFGDPPSEEEDEEEEEERREDEEKERKRSGGSNRFTFE